MAPEIGIAAVVHQLAAAQGHDSSTIRTKGFVWGGVGSRERLLTIWALGNFHVVAFSVAFTHLTLVYGRLPSLPYFIPRTHRKTNRLNCSLDNCLTCRD
jgi:hypothetical protein